MKCLPLFALALISIAAYAQERPSHPVADGVVMGRCQERPGMVENGLNATIHTWGFRTEIDFYDSGFARIDLGAVPVSMKVKKDRNIFQSTSGDKFVIDINVSKKVNGWYIAKVKGSVKGQKLPGKLYCTLQAPRT
jgi:hypothetical protein